MTFQPSVDDLSGGRRPFQSLWGSIQQEIHILTWSLTEVALFTPLAFVVLPWARFWPPGLVALLLLLAMLLSFNLSRTMSLLWLGRELQRNVMVLALILLFLFALRTLLYSAPLSEGESWLARFYDNLGTQQWSRDLALFLVITFIWWRGIRLSQQSFGVVRAGLRLRLGGLLLAPVAIWAGTRQEWEVAPYILLFCLAAMSAVAQSRAEQNERDLSGKSVFLSPVWMATVFAAGLLIVMSAGLSAAFVNGDTAVLIGAGLLPFRTAVNVGGTAVLSVIVYLSAPLFTLLDFILSSLSALFTRLLSRVMTEPLVIDLPEIPIGEETSEAIERVEPFIDGTRAIALLMMIAIVLVVAMAVGRLYRQSSIAGRPSASEPRQRQQLGRPASLRERLLNRLGMLRGWRTAASIRRIYSEMLAAAASSGYPRSEAETPFEYLPTLGEVWPENRHDSQKITEAYVRVRYGELPETKEELDGILTAWSRLSQTAPATLAQMASSGTS